MHTRMRFYIIYIYIYIYIYIIASPNIAAYRPGYTIIIHNIFGYYAFFIFALLHALYYQSL